MRVPLLVHGILVLVSAAVTTLGATVSVNDLDKYLEEKSKEKEPLALILDMSGIDEDATRKASDEAVLSPFLPRLAVEMTMTSMAEVDGSATGEEADGNHSTTVADDGLQIEGETEGKQAPNAHAPEGSGDSSDNDSTDGTSTTINASLSSTTLSPHSESSPCVGTEYGGSNNAADPTTDVESANDSDGTDRNRDSNATPPSIGHARSPSHTGSDDLNGDWESTASLEDLVEETAAKDETGEETGNIGDIDFGEGIFKSGLADAESDGGEQPVDQEVCAVRSRLGPQDPPLIPGQYLSSACSTRSTSSAPPSRPEGVCLSLSECGKMQITTGHEPNASEMILWEVDGIEEARKRRASRWYRRVGQAIKATFTRREKAAMGNEKNDVKPKADDVAPTQPDKEMDDGLQKEIRDMKLYMDGGRMTLAGTTPHAKSRGGFLGWRKRKTEKSEILYQTPKSKGYWKTSISVLSKNGREIRESELVASPQGRIAVETADESVLWEPSLNPTGSELEGA